ncbi:MAG TPA: alpha/beta hydrolase [Candidatus Kapabacteria bacterium]|nr:alpha/beta hydrolase [Candidatus Kapabacteria bacterium]
MSYFKFDGRNVYYTVEGEGFPLMLLHGNTTSSKLFENDIPFFAQYYKVIAFDWPGHGYSDKLDKFADDFWRYNAKSGLALCEHLNINTINLIGTSGGAITALNMATLNPDIAPKIIADSFFGNSVSLQDAEKITNFRQNAKKNDFLMQQYWKRFNGDYWEKMVDLDCENLLTIGKNQLPLIWGDLSTIKSDVLLVGTTTDDLIRDIDTKMAVMQEQIPNSQSAIYDYGRHTFMITEREEFRRIALNFLDTKL